MFQGDAGPNDQPKLINVLKQFFFWLVHLMCLFVFVVGFSWVALGVCISLYFVRMFGITAGFHRYFSHRSYKTSRLFQFFLGFLGTTSAQKGPIWWASHHRHHHRHSDTHEDIHSPIIHGIYYAHVGWVLSSEFVETRTELVKDLLKFPEIQWLDDYNLVPPVILASATFLLGGLLEAYFPGLGTNAFQMLIWGFFVSTVLLYHGTFCINSLAHLVGNKRFNTDDDSRNHWLCSIITLGEGWHNNHHRYPGSERQGMFWYEFDIAHYVLRFFELFGLVWDLRLHPERLYEEAKKA